MSGPAVLITGSSRGVGAACVDAFLGARWRVWAGARDPGAARAGLGERPGLTVLPLDVSDVGQVRQAVAAAEAGAGGALDCLVNNAGHALMGSQEDADLVAARRMFETNVWGTAAMVQAALPAMRAAGRGVVVNVTSIGARLVNPLVGFYHASKYAMSAMSEALAVETAPFGIRVVVIEPGMVSTEFSRSTVVTGSVATGEGPYAPMFAGLRGGFAAWRERPDTSTAADVAAAVLRAATDPASPFRVVVGGDAEFLDRAMRAAADDAAWQDALRGFLRLGPPPAPPR